MKLIDISTPKHPNTFAKVDDFDFNILDEHKWFLQNGYACTKIHGRNAYMHRLIMTHPKGWEVDHKSRDKLNNCRDNLRICSRGENSRNTDKYKSKGISKSKGVWWSDNKKRFRARIQNNGAVIFLGWFRSESEAAEAYNRAAEKYHLEFAKLNNIGA